MVGPWASFHRTVAWATIPGIGQDVAARLEWYLPGPNIRVERNPWRHKLLGQLWSSLTASILKTRAEVCVKFFHCVGKLEGIRPVFYERAFPAGNSWARRWRRSLA